MIFDFPDDWILKFQEKIEMIKKIKWYRILFTVLIVLFVLFATITTCISAVLLPIKILW